MIWSRTASNARSRRFQQFQPGTDLRAWLFTILHNVHCDQARRRPARGTHVPLEDCDHLLRLPARQGDNLEVRDLSAPSRASRTTIAASCCSPAVEGFSCEECASILGVAVGTVKSRLSRARENLRTAHLKDTPVEAACARGGSFLRPQPPDPAPLPESVRAAA